MCCQPTCYSTRTRSGAWRGASAGGRGGGRSRLVRVPIARQRSLGDRVSRSAEHFPKGMVWGARGTTRDADDRAQKSLQGPLWWPNLLTRRSASASAPGGHPETCREPHRPVPPVLCSDVLPGSRSDHSLSGLRLRWAVRVPLLKLKACRCWPRAGRRRHAALPRRPANRGGRVWIG